MMDSNHQSIGFEPTPSTNCSNGTYLSFSIETAAIAANKITAIPISVILMPGLLNVSNRNSVFVINVPKEGFEPSRNCVLSAARLPISPPGHNEKKQIIDQSSWWYTSHPKMENEYRQLSSAWVLSVYGCHSLCILQSPHHGISIFIVPRLLLAGCSSLCLNIDETVSKLSFVSRPASLDNLSLQLRLALALLTIYKQLRADCWEWSHIY